MSVEVIRQTVRTAPKSFGVYRMLSKADKVLYVGKAKNLQDRLSSYLQLKNLSKRIQKMVLQTAKVEIIIVPSETEALLLEANLIKTLHPIYNIRLRDDKSFPYIFINNRHQYPGLYKVWRKTEKGQYFGPFAAGYDMHKIIDLLRKSFFIRSCKDAEFNRRTRPCLEYDIKRCSGPCVNKVSQEDYGKLLQGVTDFLSGRNTEIREELALRMQEESEKLNFEQAAILRDRIKSINSILSKQDVTDVKLKDFDIIALASISGLFALQVFFYRGGISYGNQVFFPKADQEETEVDVLEQFLKQFYLTRPLPSHLLISHELPEQYELELAFSKLADKKVTIQMPKLGKRRELLAFALENAKQALTRKQDEQSSLIEIYYKIKKEFGLSKIPEKIEVYDNSHIQGDYAIGAMITASREGFLKQSYRKFNIENQQVKGDDYAMLKEVLIRRFSRLLADDKDRKNWPDLIFIDGGKGHATIAKEAFSLLGIPDFPFFCVAKGKERNKGKERFCNDKLNYFVIRDRDLLYYLQRIRDEVHRFAITSHRQKRAKSISKSELDVIPGIGPQKKKQLLSHFGSLANIKSSSLIDIEKAPGINSKLAKVIFEHLH